MVSNVSLQIIPLIEEEKVYYVIDKVIEYISSTGVKYEVGPMETTMEGDLEELLNIVKVAQEICGAEGAKRVASVVKIDYRPKDGITIDEKISKYRK